MNLYILIAKIILVAFFLLMFLRSNKLIWGIGLLTVTSAILLDTLLSTFSRDEILAQLGFFFYVIAGALMAGAAAWMWGLLAPYVRAAQSGAQAVAPEATVSRFAAVEQSRPNHAGSGPTTDRQMLFEQMREHLGPDDLLDVIYDLGWFENDVLAFGQDNIQLINAIIDLAEQQGQSGDLALAVERILTPIPKQNLPRLEKLSADSPPTILRHYLLAHYQLAELEGLANSLGIDWELLGGDNRKTKTRSLLLYVNRHNQLPELIDLMQTDEPIAG